MIITHSYLLDTFCWGAFLNLAVCLLDVTVLDISPLSGVYTVVRKVIIVWAYCLFPKVSPKLSTPPDTISLSEVDVSATWFTFLVDILGSLMRVSYGAMLYFLSRLAVSSDVTVRAFSTSGWATPFFRSLKRLAVQWELWHQSILSFGKWSVNRANLDWTSFIEISCESEKFF